MHSTSSIRVRTPSEPEPNLYEPNLGSGSVRFGGSDFLAKNRTEPDIGNTILFPPQWPTTENARNDNDLILLPGSSTIGTRSLLPPVDRRLRASTRRPNLPIGSNLSMSTIENIVVLAEEYPDAVKLAQQRGNVTVPFFGAKCGDCMSISKKMRIPPSFIWHLNNYCHETPDMTLCCKVLQADTLMTAEVIRALIANADFLSTSVTVRSQTICAFIGGAVGSDGGFSPEVASIGVNHSTQGIIRTSSRRPSRSEAERFARSSAAPSGAMWRVLPSIFTAGEVSHPISPPLTLTQVRKGSSGPPLAVCCGQTPNESRARRRRVFLGIFTVGQLSHPISPRFTLTEARRAALGPPLDVCRGRTPN
ncbi:hypothetical protein B0H16DRAFT_1464300 [Mycena metata]|uniref:Uncharacterized protein n=1 Tax=Mycena metata TaxID=1033252 RepID=A0AAD7N1R4_9AGAR|nr:hypothetical protein B0H16DRAFT_1464300 [Mycena metata]